MFFHRKIDIQGESRMSVAYLGFPAPGDEVSLSALTQPLPESIDSKSELRIKGCRKLTRAPHEWLFLDLFENFIWLWRQDFWIVETINYRRVKILIVSRSYIQVPISNFGHEWTFKLLYCDIPNQWRSQKFWWGGKWLEVTDWGGQKSETTFPSCI